MSIAIRSAVRNDCAAIRDIYNHYVLNDTCTYQLEAETIEERERWFAEHGAEHPVIVAESAGMIVGWAALSRYHSRCGYRHTVENSIYLRPDWRNRGLGTQLLEKLIELGRAAGHHTILAGISAEQGASIRLHAKLQFTEVARLREVGHKFGGWLDVVYMQLMLGPP
jgi:L-amino acid N-acyltransferase YncA